jgi:hypothetical protein
VASPAAEKAAGFLFWMITGRSSITLTLYGILMAGYFYFRGSADLQVCLGQG